MKVGKKLKKLAKKALKRIANPAKGLLGMSPLAQLAKPVLGQFLSQSNVPGAAALAGLL